MKKVRLLSFVLALVTVFACSFAVFAKDVAEAGYDLSYTLETEVSSVQKDGTIEIEVSFDANAGITLAGATITYDTDQLTYVSASKEGSIIPVDYLVVNAKKDWVKVTVGNDNSMDKRDLVVFDKTGLVTTLTFKALEDLDVADIDMTLKILSTKNVANDKGETGKYTNLNMEAKLAVKVVHPPVSDIFYGDVNGDGKIDAKDIVLLKKYIASAEYDEDGNIVGSTFTVTAGADVNGDGKIDAKDIVLLKKYIANATYDEDGNIVDSTVVLGPKKSA